MNRNFLSFSEQSFRRGGGTRQTSDGWRRSRGDEDENNDQNEDSSTTSANGSASWTSRGGQTRRGGGPPLENRTKSNDKWNYNDDRPGIYKNNNFILIFMFIFLLRSIE